MRPAFWSRDCLFLSWISHWSSGGQGAARGALCVQRSWRLETASEGTRSASPHTHAHTTQPAESSRAALCSGSCARYTGGCYKATRWQLCVEGLEWSLWRGAGSNGVRSQASVLWSVGFLKVADSARSVILTCTEPRGGSEEKSRDRLSLVAAGETRV